MALFIVVVVDRVNACIICRATEGSKEQFIANSAYCLK